MSAVDIRAADCRDAMAALEANSIDAIVTDPPYGLAFMGKAWDHGVPGVEFWTAALRVAKPGAHLVAFGGTRTFHRLACAIEDAGWEIRDCLSWLYGQGFPKSLDVSKAIDRAAGAAREETGRVLSVTGNRANGSAAMAQSGLGAVGAGPQEHRETLPATDAARQWQGWGTALKPAWEPIILARKPLIGTVARNVLEHGTGAINVDGCRVDGAPPSVPQPSFGVREPATYNFATGEGRNGEMSHASGRWPANVALDETAAAMLDEQAFDALHSAGAARDGSSTPRPVNCAPTSFGIPHGTGEMFRVGDSGGASRFFYTAKASRGEREAGLREAGLREAGLREAGRGDGREKPIENPYLRMSPARNTHPTVKPVDLMRWLVRLVTPPNGLVLDPFCGSGTTGVACVHEGFRFVGIELELEYVELARARIAAAERDDRERYALFHESEQRSRGLFDALDPAAPGSVVA